MLGLVLAGLIGEREGRDGQNGAIPIPVPTTATWAATAPTPGDPPTTRSTGVGAPPAGRFVVVLTARPSGGRDVDLTVTKEREPHPDHRFWLMLRSYGGYLPVRDLTDADSTSHVPLPLGGTTVDRVSAQVFEVTEATAAQLAELLPLTSPPCASCAVSQAVVLPR
jgi:hypothetical protein